MIARAPSRAPFRDRTFPEASWIVAGAISGFALAWASSFNTMAAIGVVVAAAAIFAVVARPATLLLILAVSVFIELVSVQGTTIGRLLAPIALLTVLVQLIRGRASIRPEGPVLWAGAYAFWALTSGLWTTSVSGTTFLIGSLSIALVYMLAFGSLLNTRDLERVLWAIALASLVTGAFSFHRVAQAFHVNQLLEGGRAQGLAGDPNAFAATQLVALPLVIVLAAEVRKRWQQVALYATCFVIIGSILTSLSRSGLLGLAVLLLLLIVVPFRLLFRSRQSKAISLLIVALGMSVLSIRYSGDITRRVALVFEESNPGGRSGSGRTELWKAARASIDERPWLGLGYGGFRAHSDQLLLDTPGVDVRAYPPKPGQPVHNLYLGLLVDLGIMGLVLYLGLMVSTARTLRRTARQARETGAVFAGSVAGALLLGLVTWSVISIFTPTETMRIFWIMIGLAVALSRLVTSEYTLKDTGTVAVQDRSARQVT